MATVFPFRALRPRPAAAAGVAAVPYDVVNVEEARALAEGNPLSFLRVSRAEIELPPGTDVYADAVYARAAGNFARLRQSSFELETEPSLYFYRLRMGDHEQVGLAGCFSIDEYDRDIIRKHERTRRDKEDDRTRHMIALGAQTGPVFLTYRASADVNDLARRATAGSPLFDFTATDGVQHTLWRVGGADRDAAVAAFSRIATLYIADGHHRAASAARARTDLAGRGGSQPLGDAADFTTMLAVAFPHDQVQVLAYNRVVKDLAGYSSDAFLVAVAERFTVRSGPAQPATRGEISMFVAGNWYTLTPKLAPDPGQAIASLDVSILQDNLLEPILKIADVRTDKRIDFVGGARGTGELERHVTAGRFAVAFSLYPVSVADLMAVSDANAIMPPKSTWFEPKLRDGLLLHVI
ncbi:MAG TPA: DUF1015 family protein [Vicinamibacterales bacterium]|nr:DUF1015 family protein [Vicinamibacterales bacterium]